MQIHRKKRRAPAGPSKSELRASRTERQERERSQIATFRESFPRVRALNLELRLETPAGATLESVSRSVDLNEPMLLDVPCQGGCGGGLFLLTDAIEGLLREGVESREGLALCQAASYMNPGVPCGTKLFYRVTAEYES